MSDLGERLDALEDAVTQALGAGLPGLPAVLAAARAEATRGAPQPPLAAARFAAGTLARLALAAVAGTAPAGPAVGRAAAALLTALPADERGDVTLRALGHPALATAPLADALAAHATLLATLGGVQELSAWRPDLAGRLARVAQAGPASPPDAARALARRCLEDGRAVAGSGGLAATPVVAFTAPAAVLVWRAGTERDGTADLVAESGAALAAPLQHALTADANLEGHRALVAGPERRLTRLALDLHDGALQDVALVAGELRRLEDDLRPALRDHPDSERVRLTLETLASLVAALDADLREVATTLEGPSLLRRPFAEALEAVAAAFRARARLPLVLEVSGDLTALTDSQRITLFRVVQESLANVRQHADAGAVSVRVTGLGTHVDAEVLDDGLGFDVEAVVDRAGREGRLGLIGMAERVRLLGGRCSITSQPGRGTRVQVVLARYEPLPDRRASASVT